MPNKALSETGESIVGPLVPTTTRAAPGASTLVAFATAEQTKARCITARPTQFNARRVPAQQEPSRVLAPADAEAFKAGMAVPTHKSFSLGKIENGKTLPDEP
jgi:hypothetical protein